MLTFFELTGKLKTDFYGFEYKFKKLLKKSKLIIKSIPKN